MKRQRVLTTFARGSGGPNQAEIEALIAQSPSVLGSGNLFVPPHYTLLRVSDLQPSYDAYQLLAENLEVIDTHLHGQCCCGGEVGQVALAQLYNFISIEDGMPVIEGAQLVHLYEHLLLHPLMRFRRVKNRRIQARSTESTIFFDNTFEIEADDVSRLVWRCLIDALRGRPYPTIKELDAEIGYAVLAHQIEPAFHLPAS